MSHEEVDGVMWCSTHGEPVDECNDNICRGDDSNEPECEIVPLYIRSHQLVTNEPAVAPVRTGGLVESPSGELLIPSSGRAGVTP